MTRSDGRGDVDPIFNDRFEDNRIDPDEFAWRVLERISYGARPEDLAQFNGLGSTVDERLDAWLDLQLNWQALPDNDLQSRLSAAGFQTLGKPITQLWADHVRGSMNGSPERYFPVAETDAARLMRATYSSRQLYEMMVEFWHDHFNVTGWDFSIAPVFVQHDRDAIRPQALGNFRTLLESVAKSTAMQYYLDNKSNRRGGYNENWARELMELHTLGSEVYYPGAFHGQVPIGEDGLAVGYSDADVYDVARCFTGWTIRDGHWQFPDTPEYDTGEFFYHSAWHEGGQKNVLDQWVGPAGQEEARTVMDLLARHSATARHLCTKLCRRFVADEPPQSLVDSAASVWQANWQSPDQIALVLRHILGSEEFKSGQGSKVRRPFELMVSAFRKCGAEIEPRHYDGWTPYGELFGRFQQTGHGSFRWPAPDGYPDTAARWTSASVMGQSWRLLSRLPELREANDGPFLLDVQGITEAAFPLAADRTAANLVDFWVQRLLGGTIDAARRQRLVDFLRQNAAADVQLDISSGLPYGNWSSGNLSAHYTPVRLRAMVSLILISPEFHQR
ncbi:DUF1800 domain-containing protein [Wenzhouxiangella marina]|nr:DUF1800 domain-containing protein [Wenzhouxiangella marina]MBB6086230.1 uncharacterized protein (DUF1800 family) [Wenzhouxiangella marina]